jgi:hypothetical protein
MKNPISIVYNKYPVATSLVGVVMGYIAFRYIKNKLNKPDVPQVPPIPVPGQIPNPQSKYTYGAQQYNDFAKLLHGYMYPWGTDEDGIAKILSKMKTYDDVLALIDAYGTRTLRSEWGWDTDPKNLAQAFDYEMSPDYVETYVNQPLKRTGYKF